MKILFCTDGSKSSYKSIVNAVKWFKKPIVDIVCVADWSFLNDSIIVEDTDFMLKCANSATSILNSAEDFLSGQDIIVGEKIQVCGSVVDSIIEVIEESNYDLVVLGSNGKKGLKKWLGSVSQEVSSYSMISTYIAKEYNSAIKILFTVDFTDTNNKSIIQSLNILDLTDKVIYLATVCEIPDYLFLEGNINTNWIKDIDKKQTINANILLGKFEKIFENYNLKVAKKIVLKGNPSVEIVKFSEKENIDLVLCGVRTRKNMAKFLAASVSSRILENSKSDILIIRPNNYQ